MTFPPDIGTTLMQRRPDLVAKLSPREREVLSHWLGPGAVPVIAKRMFKSPHTVVHHVKSMYLKFGITSREELILLFAVMQPPPPPEQAQQTTEAA